MTRSPQDIIQAILTNLQWSADIYRSMGNLTGAQVSANALDDAIKLVRTEAASLLPEATQP